MLDQIMKHVRFLSRSGFEFGRQLTFYFLFPSDITVPSDAHRRLFFCFPGPSAHSDVVVEDCQSFLDKYDALRDRLPSVRDEGLAELVDEFSDCTNSLRSTLRRLNRAAATKDRAEQARDAALANCVEATTARGCLDMEQEEETERARLS